MLAEILATVVIASLMAVSLLAGLCALVKGLQAPSVVISGETLPMAPTFGSFPSAVRLHQMLTMRTAVARAIYVFGGSHLSIPDDSPAAALRPLDAESLPAIADFASGLPMDAKTFYDLYEPALGKQESNSSPDDFSIVVVGPHGTGLGITCFVQARRRAVSVSDGAASNAFRVREVRLWDIDEGLFRYAFAEDARRAPNLFVGAVHTWLRYPSNGAPEEGPACVAFPDPWIYAGARGRPDDVPAYSRFLYILPVSP